MAEKLCELKKKGGSSTPTVADITIINSSGYPVIYNGTTLVRSTSSTNKIQREDFQCWYNGSNFTVKCARAGQLLIWQAGNPITTVNVPANTEVTFTMPYGGAVFVYS